MEKLAEALGITLKEMFVFDDAEKRPQAAKKR